MRGDTKARRHLDLEGAYNIRDIGGYPTSGGRHTRWQMLVRADALHRLTATAQAALIDYGLRTVIDLRSSAEVRKDPDVFEQSDRVTYYHQAMIGEVLEAEMAKAPVPDTILEQFLQTYTTILDRRRDQICVTLSTLATPGTLPAAVHCHGGKDRTGLVIALILGIIGVPPETIVEDYVLSARFLLRRRADGRAPSFEADYNTEKEYRQNCCPPEVMLATLRHLNERYGGIESYLLGSGFGRDRIESLRSALIE